MAALRASMFTPLEADEPESASEVCRVYRFRLNPLPTSNPEAPAEAPLAGAAASATARSPSAHSPAPIEQRDPTADLTTADGPAETEAPEELVVTATRAEPDAAHGRVCKDRRRPGSMIAATICYSREEQPAFERDKQRTLSELEQEQRWRDQVINDAKMKNEWPRGGGLGPNH